MTGDHQLTVNCFCEWIFDGENMFVVVAAVAASMCGIQSVQNKKPEWGKIIASYFSMPSGPIWLHAFWGGKTMMQNIFQ